MIDTASLDPGRPVLIAGPTASGKSALAMEIAARTGGVIVNADALQVYGCWRVLTARPSPADEAALPHRLYGHVPCDAAWSVGDWLRDVARLMGDLPGPPVFVGGTGLYFTALTEGLAEIPPVPAEVRAEAEALIATEGHAGLCARLAEADPDTHARIDARNPMRVQRAWEVLRATGRPLSSWQAETGPPLMPLAEAQAFVVEADRDWLNSRIETRFRAMLEAGALDEARAALPCWQPDLPAFRAIGAPELVAHLQGRMTLAEAETAAIAATRNYAKRQRTWFRTRMRAWTPVPAAR